ncbi:MAG: class I SAM-dependent methyltransferase [Solirubrobacterales bacterium]
MEGAHETDPRPAREGQDRDARVEAFFADAENYFASGGAYSEPRSRLLRLMLGDCAGLDIIDLGCGDGTLSLQFLPEARSVTLVDRSREMLDAARRIADTQWEQRVRYLQADLSGFRTEEQFDVVLCIGVLAHVPDVSEVLDLIAGLLRPGGRCAVQLTDRDRRLVPLHDRYAQIRRRFGSADRRGYETNRMSVASIRAAAAQRGLRFSAVRHYGLLVPGLDRLPASVAKAVERASWKRPWVSRHAVEAIILFTAPGGR